jgi:hypothetical protein
MKKLLLVGVIAVIAGTSCQEKDSVNDINLPPDVIYLDVIAVDDNPAATVTQGTVVTVKVQP